MFILHVVWSASATWHKHWLIDITNVCITNTPWSNNFMVFLQGHLMPVNRFRQIHMQTRPEVETHHRKGGFSKLWHKSPVTDGPSGKNSTPWEPTRNDAPKNHKCGAIPPLMWNCTWRILEKKKKNVYMNKVSGDSQRKDLDFHKGHNQSMFVSWFP